jgi:hypothetical protein
MKTENDGEPMLCFSAFIFHLSCLGEEENRKMKAENGNNG